MLSISINNIPKGHQCQGQLSETRKTVLFKDLYVMDFGESLLFPSGTNIRWIWTHCGVYTMKPLITSNWRIIINIFGVKRNSLTPKQRRTKKKSETQTQRNIRDTRDPLCKIQVIQYLCYWMYFIKRKDFCVITDSLTYVNSG